MGLGSVVRVKITAQGQGQGFDALLSPSRLESTASRSTASSSPLGDCTPPLPPGPELAPPALLLLPPPPPAAAEEAEALSRCCGLGCTRTPLQ